MRRLAKDSQHREHQKDANPNHLAALRCRSLDWAFCLNLIHETDLSRKAIDPAIANGVVTQMSHGRLQELPAKPVTAVPPQRRRFGRLVSWQFCEGRTMRRFLLLNCL